jgi:hypothetical protein
MEGAAVGKGATEAQAISPRRSRGSPAVSPLRARRARGCALPSPAAGEAARPGKGRRARAGRRDARPPAARRAPGGGRSALDDARRAGRRPTERHVGAALEDRDGCRLCQPGGARGGISPGAVSRVSFDSGASDCRVAHLLSRAAQLAPPATPPTITTLCIVPPKFDIDVGADAAISIGAWMGPWKSLRYEVLVCEATGHRAGHPSARVVGCVLRAANARAARRRKLRRERQPLPSTQTAARRGLKRPARRVVSLPVYCHPPPPAAAANLNRGPGGAEPGARVRECPGARWGIAGGRLLGTGVPRARRRARQRPKMHAAIAGRPGLGV